MKFGIKINNPYRMVQDASQNAAKQSNLMRENFLQTMGTIGVNNVPAIGNIPIIHPKISSLKFSFLPNVGNKGDTKE